MVQHFAVVAPPLFGLNRAGPPWGLAHCRPAGGTVTGQDMQLFPCSWPAGGTVAGQQCRVLRFIDRPEEP